MGHCFLEMKSPVKCQSMLHIGSSTVQDSTYYINPILTVKNSLLDNNVCVNRATVMLEKQSLKPFFIESIYVHLSVTSLYLLIRARRRRQSSKARRWPSSVVYSPPTPTEPLGRFRAKRSEREKEIHKQFGVGKKFDLFRSKGLIF